MGLDIVAYEHLVRVGDGARYDDLSDEHKAAYDNGDLVLICDEHEAFAGRLGGMEPGLYKPEASWCDKMHFCAGSYGSYNGWRNQLSEVFTGMSAHELYQDPEKTDYPFYELINFSDCEGQIGGEVAKKLSQDFYENFYKAIQWAANLSYPPHPQDSEQDIAQARAECREEAEYFLYKYFKWMEAFSLASNNGVVCFC